jgi:hypothetical protein
MAAVNIHVERMSTILRLFISTFLAIHCVENLILEVGSETNMRRQYRQTTCTLVINSPEEKERSSNFESVQP